MQLPKYSHAGARRLQQGLVFPAWAGLAPWKPRHRPPRCLQMASWRLGLGEEQPGLQSSEPQGGDLRMGSVDLVFLEMGLVFLVNRKQAWLNGGLGE